MSGTSTIGERKEMVHTHWCSIMIGPDETPAEFLRNYNYDHAEVLTAETVVGDFEAFLEIVSKQTDGRARGEDGRWRSSSSASPPRPS